MKKIIMGIFAIIIMLSLTGCGNKKALTNDEFYKILGDEGFTINDVTSLIEDENVEVLGAANNNSYQIEYHIYKTIEASKIAYEGNKKAFQAYKKENNKEKVIEGNNYGKYTLELSDEYKVVSRIDNTLVYASISLEYKKDLNIILDKLGY